jgi:hypothetical protein
MKKKILFLLSLVLIISCSKSKDEVTVDNSILLNIDNVPYKIINENVGGNENCNYVYVSSGFKVNDRIKFYLNFTFLKNGELSRIRYDELDVNQGGVSKIFFTPDFNPVSAIVIKNYVYEPNENYISFEFEGTVYEENKVSNIRHISGKVEVKNLKRISCGVQLSKIEFENSELKFYTTNYIRSSNSLSSDQTHTYLSNNGFKLKLKSSDDFWNLPLSTISFNEMSSNNKIEFEQYIGQLVAGQLLNYNNIVDWKVFETRGNFTIEQKVIENGGKTIKGKINIEVLFQGNLIYTINNMNYSTGSNVL